MNFLLVCSINYNSLFEIHEKFKGRVIYELELNSTLNCFGGFNNQYYDPNNWKCLDSKFCFELPRETLLIAEKCVEYSGEVTYIKFIADKI